MSEIELKNWESYQHLQKLESQASPEFYERCGLYGFDLYKLCKFLSTKQHKSKEIMTEIKQVWLLENQDLEEDDDFRIIWSPDSDCEQIHEGFKIIGHYVSESALQAKLDIAVEALKLAYDEMRDMEGEDLHNDWYVALDAIKTALQQIQKGDSE